MVVANVNVVEYRFASEKTARSVRIETYFIHVDLLKRTIAESLGQHRQWARELHVLDPATGDDLPDTHVVYAGSGVLVARRPTNAFSIKVLRQIKHHERLDRLQKSTPSPDEVEATDESALARRLKSVATGWGAEVRAGAKKRCPRCGGAHYAYECHTVDDPEFDKKVVPRMPHGIPMTRLRHSDDGGLVLPTGQAGTIVANEHAFQKEIGRMM